MAIFDPTSQKIVIRVIYDGVAYAGKTTNLRQLSALFAAHSPREVVSPAEIRGRTMYFDWIEVEAGVVSGMPISSQVLSVPGQDASLRGGAISSLPRTSSCSCVPATPAESRTRARAWRSTTRSRATTAVLSPS